MGAQDQSGQWKEAGVPQEVITVVRESDPGSQKAMLHYLYRRNIAKERVSVNWDTWKGVYFTPPEGEIPWTQEEYNRIKEYLEAHPNVDMVDESPSAGSVG